MSVKHLPTWTMLFFFKITHDSIFTCCIFNLSFAPFVQVIMNINMLLYKHISSWNPKRSSLKCFLGEQWTSPFSRHHFLHYSLTILSIRECFQSRFWFYLFIFFKSISAFFSFEGYKFFMWKSITYRKMVIFIFLHGSHTYFSLPAAVHTAGEKRDKLLQAFRHWLYPSIY